MHFLRKLLPTDGLYCVALALDGDKGYKHYFHSSVEDTISRIKALDDGGNTVFLAQASFEENTRRTQKNAKSVRAFFFDIDCGEGKPYAGQREAVAALKEFVEETGLPFPAVVSSGYGLYAYWFLEDDVPAGNWRMFGQMLKKVAAATGFKVDPVRTADSASIMRPPGATNRKRGTTKPVQLVRDSDPIPNEKFIELLEAAAKRCKVDRSALQPPKRNDDINADFLDIGQEEVEFSALLIADKCAQLKKLRDSRGDVDEPIWYASLGVLRYTIESPDIIQEWSSGYAGYSPEETAAKIQHHEESGARPTTCAYFGEINPDACLACPSKNKIKSPISLGRPEILPMELEPEELTPPEPFLRTKKGLVYVEDGNQMVFYDQDLYPAWTAYDEGEGYEVMSLRHTTPHDGDKETLLRSSLVNDPKALMVSLADNHVKVMGNKEKKIMVAYLEGYMKKLQANRAMKKMLTQMGWRELGGELVFVLGKKVFHRDGTVDDAALSNSVPTAAEAFATKGDPNLWTEQTAKLDAPGMEAHAFTLLAGAFGAPLMRFTGFDGAMISTVGPSGSGKTLMARWAQSAYGDNLRLMMLRDDTRNSLVSRLGTYGSLPLTVDEVTNISADELSDLVYRVTQGRDKARLGRNAVERPSLNHWNTLAVVSSNESLYGKLASLKCDASAEVNRLFEYTVDSNLALGRDSATEVFRTIQNNYGHIGERYVQYLVGHTAEHQAKIDQLTAHIDAATNAQPDERFWSAIAAVAIYGGLIARKLGLIQFEITPILEWVITTIKSMRDGKIDMVRDSISLLGQFLDENANHRVVVKVDEDNPKKGVSQVIDPRGALHIRLEANTYQMYISRPVLSKWFASHYGDFSKFCKEMEDLGALRKGHTRKSLGAGTNYASVPQRCLRFDLSNPILGHVKMKMVSDLRQAEKDAVAGIE